MGVHVIKTPDIGEGIAEVELVDWHVQDGDAVVADQILADLMTDKATVEVPSPVAGRVLALGGKPGQLIAVGAELIRIEVQGAGNADVAAAASAAARAEAAKPAAPASGTPMKSPAPAPSSAQLAPASAAPALKRPGERPIASPAVRRRAWELGIELQFVPGSGGGGRILHQDHEAYAPQEVASGHAPQEVALGRARRKWPWHAARGGGTAAAAPAALGTRSGMKN